MVAGGTRFAFRFHIMNPQNQNEARRRDWESLRESLRSLRDEIKVRAHLATLDMKDEWNKLEPKLTEAEQYADLVTDAALAAGKELQRRAQQLGEKLSRLQQQHKLRN
jgi:hypothetical protein